MSALAQWPGVGGDILRANHQVSHMHSQDNNQRRVPRSPLSFGFLECMQNRWSWQEVFWRMLRRSDVNISAEPHEAQTSKQLQVKGKPLSGGILLIEVFILKVNDETAQKRNLPWCSMSHVVIFCHFLPSKLWKDHSGNTDGAQKKKKVAKIFTQPTKAYRCIFMEFYFHK